MRKLLKSLFERRSRAYKDVFEKDNRSVNIVLADLRKFCFATGGVFDSDPLVLARKVGRQEVFERMRSYINVTEDELYKYTETLETDYGDD
jgi:translation initiation factor 2 beta subunit (eIF-2beta)/eIF-5